MNLLVDGAVGVVGMFVCPECSVEVGFPDVRFEAIDFF
jgi:hypothetical protein